MPEKESQNSESFPFSGKIKECVCVCVCVCVHTYIYIYTYKLPSPHCLFTYTGPFLECPSENVHLLTLFLPFSLCLNSI